MPSVSRISPRFKKLAALDVKAAAEAIFADMPGKADDCDFMAALRASKLTGLELLAAVVTFPGYFPRVTAVDSLAMGPDLFEPSPLADWMGFWAAEIAAQPFEELNKSVQRILTERAADLPPEAWAPLIGWIGEGHPKAAEFLAMHQDAATISL